MASEPPEVGRIDGDVSGFRLAGTPERHPREKGPPVLIVLALVLWGVLVWYANR